MALEPEDLEIIEDLITQKVDSEIFVLRQDLERFPIGMNRKGFP